MANDPLSVFLQNGSKPLKNDAVPVNYRIQPAQQPQQSQNILDRMNPVNWLKSQLANTPELQEVMKIVEQNGGDAKAAFYNECQARGKDPNEILNHPLFRKFFK